MPSPKILEKKKAIVAALSEKLKSAASGVLVDYKGINVEEDTRLRKELREAGVEYAVIKNTMIRFAAKDAGLDGLDEHLAGTSALAISMDDVIAPARIVSKYAKDLKKLEIKVGIMEGHVIDAAQVKELADLPSRETLIAQVLYGFNTPITKLAIALHAIAEKKEQEEATAS